jgi:hypothetical protein
MPNIVSFSTRHHRVYKTKRKKREGIKKCENRRQIGMFEFYKLSNAVFTFTDTFLFLTSGINICRSQAGFVISVV